MAYLCPRCGSAVSRKYSSSAQFAAGLVGALFVGAFGGFTCPKCGGIGRSEFSQADRNRTLLGTLAMIVSAAVLLVVCFMFLAK